MSKQEKLIQNSGAVFDLTGTYRYSLWRAWSFDYPRVVFIMLNPSTADGMRNDPTIRRCIQFAHVWKFGSLEVVNLFAYRATSPCELLKADDPIGRENDRFLIAAMKRGSHIIVAWGTKGTLFERNREVIQLLVSDKKIFCLGMTKDGHPLHPLYVRGDTHLISFPDARLLRK